MIPKRIKKDISDLIEQAMDFENLDWGTLSNDEQLAIVGGLLEIVAIFLRAIKT